MPVYHSSETIFASSGGTSTRSFSVTIPAAVSDTLVALHVAHYGSATRQVSDWTIDAAQAGEVQVGSQTTYDGSTGEYAQYQGYVTGLAAGATYTFEVTFDESLGSGPEVGISYAVFSDVDQTNPLDTSVALGFEENFFGSAGGSALTINYTTNDDNSCGFFAAADFNNSTNGDVETAGWTQSTPTQDFFESWYEDDVGSAGAKTLDFRPQSSAADFSYGAMFFRAPAAAGVALGRATETSTARALPSTGGATVPSLGNITQSGTSTDALSPRTENFDHNNNGEDLLVFVFIHDSATNTANVSVTASYNSVAMTSVGESESGFTDDIPRIEAFFLAGAASGTNQVSVTMDLQTNQGIQAYQVIAISVSDCGGVGANIAAATSDANVNTLSPTINVLQENSRLIGAASAQGSDTDPYTAGSGYAIIAEFDTGATLGADFTGGVQTRATTATGNTTFDMSWNSNDDSAILGIELLPPADVAPEIGRVTTTDTARTLAASKTAAIGGPATETSAARSLVHTKSDAIGRVTTVNAAGALTASKSAAIGRATETDSANSLTTATAFALGRATDTSVSRTLTVEKTAPLARTTETNQANAPGSSKVAAVGRATETDTARSFDTTLVLGRVTETSAARSIVSSQSVGLGAASETDAARSFQAARNFALGRVTETSAANALVGSKSVALGRATESNSARALLTADQTAFGRVTETDAAGAFVSSKVTALGRASDIGIPTSFIASKTVALGRVTETDTARSLGTAVDNAIGKASEADQAGSFVGSKAAALGRATETSVARALLSSGSLGRATETDLARGLTAFKTTAIGRAGEASAARAIVGARTFTIGRAVDLSAARALTHERLTAIGRASETSAARSLTGARFFDLGRASESDAARTLAAEFSISIGRTSETDQARTITASKSQALGRATETNTARGLLPPGIFELGKVTETSAARSLQANRDYALGRVTEVSAARAFNALIASQFATLEPIPGPVALVEEPETVFLAEDDDTVTLSEEFETVILIGDD